MNKKLTYRDFEESKPNDLRKFYGLSNHELEQQHRKHLEGANTQEMRREYEKFYRRNRRDA